MKHSLRFMVDVFDSWYSNGHVTHERVTGMRAQEIKTANEGKRVVVRPVRVGAQTELRLRRVEV